MENKSKYLVFVTPKAFASFDSTKLGDFSDAEIVPTSWIYMNLMEESWDADRCDNTAYIVERESFEENKVEFRIAPND